MVSEQQLPRGKEYRAYSSARIVLDQIRLNARRSKRPLTLLLSLISIGLVLFLGVVIGVSSPANISLTRERFGVIRVTAIVERDASLSVVAEYPVTVAGEEIKRGFGLTLPLRGKLTNSDEVVNLAYSVARITRQDPSGALAEIAPYTKLTPQGEIILRLGSPEDPELSPGDYLYTVQYQVTGAIRHESERDSLLFYPLFSAPLPIDGISVAVKLPPGVPPGALGTGTIAQPIGVEYGEDEASGGEVFEYTLPAPVAMSAAVEGTGNKLQTILSYRTSGALRRREGLGIEGAWPSLGNSFWRSGASKAGSRTGGEEG